MLGIELPSSVILLLFGILLIVFWFRVRKLRQTLILQLERLHKTEEELRQERSRINAELLVLQQREQTLDDSRHEHESLQTAIARDQEQLQKERLEFDHVKQQLHADRVNLVAELKKLDDAKKELTDKRELDRKVLEQEHQKLREERSRLEVDRQSLGELREKLQGEKRLLDEENEQLRSQQGELAEARSSLDREWLQLKQEQDALQSLQASVVREQDYLQKERLEFQNEKHQLHIDHVNVVIGLKQLDDVKKELMKKHELDLKFFEGEHQKLDQERSRLDAYRQDVGKQLESLQNEMRLLENLREQLKFEQTELRELIQQKEEQDQLEETSQFPDSLSQEVKPPQAHLPVSPDSPKQENLDPRVIEPQNRGGRPRKREESSLDSSAKRETERQPRISIVCAKSGWLWEIGIELPEELESLESVQVRQGDEALERNGQHNALWLLKDVEAPALIQWSEDELHRVAQVKVDRRHLVFKLAGDQDRGRLVKSLTIGSYAVFVPGRWERDESVSGSPTVQPENAAWAGYKVHFFDFHTDETSTVAFRSEDGIQHILSEKLQIDLHGNRIPDVSENVGPLFGGSVPSLRTTTLRSLSQITTIVLGEEGSGGNKWRTSFPYNQLSHQQELPSDLAARGANWYFTRFYDSKDELIGSLDFRYVPELQSVRVQHCSETVSKSTVVIEFVHDTSCTISPEDEFSSKAHIETVDGKSIARHEFDSATQSISRWVVQSFGVPIHLALDLSRLCWNLGDETSSPEKWQRQPLYLTRELFKPTGSSCLYVSLPRSHQGKHALVGFSREKGQYHRVRTQERLLKIGLRDFSDAQEIESSSRAALNVWLNLTADFAHDTGEHFVVATIPQLTTTYHCIIDQCEFLTEAQSLLFHHLATQHDILRYLQPVDDYEEFLRHYKSILGSNWPRKIYLCMHCEKYVSADDTFDNPSDAIYHHLLSEHSGKTHSFRIVRSVGEIRQEVIASLPKLYRCKYDDSYFEGKDVNGTWSHFLSAHEIDFVHTTVAEEPSPTV